ncbi:thiamine pyrophosphate-binding protein [Cellulosimicrobium cellulans]|uniref:thiamine pyrophosphate-binding protein n=1 Tax=Cellulosimicrobium cellulans TaxID=1710 RepID=UPI0032669CBD
MSAPAGAPGPSAAAPRDGATAFDPLLDGTDAQPPAVRSAFALVHRLALAGVADVVLAPGSRSAPLAYALAAASDLGHLTLHVRVDERAAGFLAVGLSRGAGPVVHGGVALPRPVAIVTTSGTAVANLHPAVLEAHHTGVPLVLLTADRPHELRGTGANQTTHQAGIFGPAVRFAADVPAPDGRPGEVRDLVAVATRALAEAVGARSGTPARSTSTSRTASPSSPASRPASTRSPRRVPTRAASARPSCCPPPCRRARSRATTPRSSARRSRPSPCRSPACGPSSSRATGRAVSPATSPRRAAGRCSRSRRRGRRAARTWSSRTRSCSGSTRSWTAWSTSSCSAARRSRGPCSACSGGPTSR